MAPHPPAPLMASGRVARSHRGPGLLLVVPAALTALVSLVVPTGQTIVRSFQRGGILGRAPRSAGLDNYTELLGHGVFWKALLFSLSLAIVPLLIILVIGPLLAAALDRAGTWPRRAGRVLLSLPLVVFSPVAIAMAWLAGQRDGGVSTAFGRLSEVGAASPTVPLITAAALFGVLCGLALLVFLPVMRGARVQGRPLTPAMLAVGAITGLAAIAVALQAFSVSLTMVSGRQATLANLHYRRAFAYFDFGGASAISTLMGLMLGVLGVLATVVAVGTGLRVELGPAGRDGVTDVPRDGRYPRPVAPGVPANPPTGHDSRSAPQSTTSPAGEPDPHEADDAPASQVAAETGRDTDGEDPGTGRPLAYAPAGSPRPGGGGGGLVVGVLALAAVLAITILCSWPWLSAVFSGGHAPPVRASSARVYANTWIPPLLSAIVSVGTAYLAALGIGGLRPLGRNSEWLLLLFAPWLFVGITPLSVSDYENIRHLHLLDHFLALLPPILLSVPSLLVLTLFCRTRAARWRAEQAGGGPAFVRIVALPALPLAVFMGGVTVFFGAQGLLWPLLTGIRSDLQTAPTALLRQTSVYTGAKNAPYGLATPLIVVIVALLVLAALQVLYFDRLLIVTGPGGEPGDEMPAVSPLPMPMPRPQWSGPAAYGPPPGYGEHPGYPAPGYPPHPGPPPGYTTRADPPPRRSAAHPGGPSAPSGYPDRSGTPPGHAPPSDPQSETPPPLPPPT